MDTNFNKPPESPSPSPSTQGVQKPGTADQIDQTAEFKEAAGPARLDVSDWYKESGMGLKFINIEAADREFIRKFVRDEVMRDIKTSLSHDTFDPWQ